MFSNRGSSSTRTYDRLIGIFVTIGAVLTLGAASNFMQRLYTAHMKREEEEERRRRGLGAKGDDLHQSRWKNAQGPQAVHSGACHCNRIRFRVRAATTVYAVDVPSKVRFPRLSIPVENFEPLTDESIMSLYAVKTAAQGMGIHTFCSYCGVHVVYAPDTDPNEIQVNVDCLDRSTIERVLVSYLATAESEAVPITYAAAEPFNRRGSGAFARQQQQQQQQPTPLSSAHDSNSMFRNMYMLEGGSVTTEQRFRSPDKTNSDPWELRESTKPGSAGAAIYSASPFSRNKQLNSIRSRYVEDACSSYLDSYYTAGQSSAYNSNSNGTSVPSNNQSDVAPLGPYGGFNSQGQYDNPMYTGAEKETEAPQWNRYYSGGGVKESLDGEVDISSKEGADGNSGSSGSNSGYGSLVTSPIKLRTFAETTNAAFGLSPNTFSKQLDSMQKHLSHYPKPEDDELTLPKRHNMTAL